MTNKQRKKIAGIIHSSAAAGAAISGLSAQIPLADNVALAGIEIAMVIKIGKVLDQEISRSTAWSLVLSRLGTISGKLVAKKVARFVPIAGNVSNAVTSASIIETMGWSIADYLDFSEDTTEKAS